MFSKIGQLIFDNEVIAQTSDFNMGLEVEMQRVDENGDISQEPYPTAIGDERTNPWITVDYLDTMTESVTPAASNALDAIHYLYGINNVLRTALAPGELLWPLSMPPRLPKDKSKLKLAQMGPDKEAYLKEWTKRHGYSAGTPCGVHVNLSIDQHIIDLVFDNFKDEFKSKVAVQNYLYTVLAQGFVRYRWLITYLFGASPVAEDNYFEKGHELKQPIRSIRQSSYGFGNKFEGDYSSVQGYVDAIEQAAKDDILISDYEFHGPVRLKGKGKLVDLEKNGVDYLELRMLDLDPSSSVGVRTGTLRFLRLLASYFIMNPVMNPKDVKAVLHEADKINDVVSKEHPTEVTKYQTKARAFVHSLERYANQIQLGPEFSEILEDLDDRVENPKTTPSAKLLAYVKDGSLSDYALRRAKRYQEAALESIHTFSGFENGAVLTAEELKESLFKGSWTPA